MCRIFAATRRLHMNICILMLDNECLHIINIVALALINIESNIIKVYIMQILFCFII